MQSISKHRKHTKEYGARSKRSLCAAVKARLFACVIIILAFVACIIFGFSHPAPVAEEARSANRTVKAGVFNFEGYHMRDEDGKISGYGI